jgi:hypothetical protein
LQASDAVGAVNDGVDVHSIVVFAPALPIVGACVSTFVIDWLRVTDVLPQSSTAYHVFVIVTEQELPDTSSSLASRTVEPLQASLAVGGVNEGVAVHSIVVFAPALPIVGACVSICVTV